MQGSAQKKARNLCNKNAHTTQIHSETECPVIDLMPWQKEILKKSEYGATMRLGSYAAKLEPNTIVDELYKTFGQIQSGFESKEKSD